MTPFSISDKCTIHDTNLATDATSILGTPLVSCIVSYRRHIGRQSYPCTPNFDNQPYDIDDKVAVPVNFHLDVDAEKGRTTLSVNLPRGNAISGHRGIHK